MSSSEDTVHMYSWFRTGLKPNNHRRSNTQTITTGASNGFDIPDVTETKPPTPPPSATTTNRAGLVAPNTAPNNRTRPPVARPIQAYRGSQTTYNNNNNNVAKVQQPVATTPVQRNGKKATTDLGSTFTAKQFSPVENGLLNDVSNKPLTGPVRSQLGTVRRTALPQSSIEQIPPSSSIDMTPTLDLTQPSIPRSSSSSLSQGRKSGIPTIGKQRPSMSTMTRWVIEYDRHDFLLGLFACLDFSIMWELLRVFSHHSLSSRSTSSIKF